MTNLGLITFNWWSTNRLCGWSVRGDLLTRWVTNWPDAVKHSLYGKVLTKSRIWSFQTTLNYFERNATLVACSHRRHGQNKSLNCLRVGGVNRIGDKTHWRQDDKIVLSCLDTVSNLDYCSVSNILRTSENLEIGNWVETKQNCFVNNCLQLCSHRPHGQDKTVICCPCRRCEQAVTDHSLLLHISASKIQDSGVESSQQPTSPLPHEAMNAVLFAAADRRCLARGHAHRQVTLIATAQVLLCTLRGT